MTKLYKTLAWFTFAIFLVVSISLALHLFIDKSAQKSNETINKLTEDFNSKLEKSEKLVHNLAFYNCFPNLCGKVSFLTLGLKEKNFGKTIQHLNAKQLDELGRFDLIAGDYITVKYSPIFNKLSISADNSYVIALRNYDKVGHVSFNDFSLNLNPQLINFYKNLTDPTVNVENLVKYLKGENSFNAQMLRIGIGEDIRIKFEKLDTSDIVTAIKNKTISKLISFNVVNASLKGHNKKYSLGFDLTINNFAKDVITKWIALSRNSLISAKPLNDATAQKELIHQNTALVMDYAQSLIKAIENINENNTTIELSDMQTTITQIANDKETINTQAFANLDFTLDEKLNPVMDLQIDVKTNNQPLIKVLDSGVMRLPSKEGLQETKVFEKTAEGHLKVNANAENGKITVNNQDPITVDGLIENGLNFAKGMLQMMSMGLASKL